MWNRSSTLRYMYETLMVIVSKLISNHCRTISFTCISLKQRIFISNTFIPVRKPEILNIYYKLSRRRLQIRISTEPACPIRRKDWIEILWWIFICLDIIIFSHLFLSNAWAKFQTIESVHNKVLVSGFSLSFLGVFLLFLPVTSISFQFFWSIFVF